MRIGIIGMGYVGSAVYAGVKPDYRDNVMVHDKYKDIPDGYPLNSLKNNCSVIFICVSTPQNKDGSIDASAVREVIKNLKDFNGTIILKSTIVYNQIPKDLNIVCNPEFLDERTSIQDFRNQDYIVLGGEITESMKVAEMYLRYFRFNNPINFEFCTVKEASDFKYIRNVYSAYKVLFWNFVHEISDSRKMSEMLKRIPISEMSVVGMDGELGYDGACLPKDVNALNAEHQHELTKFMKEYNDKLND